MARSARQSKILELISINEIETQDDLVSRLRANKFDVTQATISRDIKELGLVKILSNETGKYKYSTADISSHTSNKYIYLLKESTISVKSVKNFVVVKTLSGLASCVCNIIGKLNIENSLGSTYGEDTVFIIFADSTDAEYALNKLENIIES
jgi:transcriptional regulator of arginine metabolism